MQEAPRVALTARDFPLPVEAAVRADELKRSWRADIPVLMFHYIREMSPADPDQLGYRLSFSPTCLEKFLTNLAVEGFETVTFRDIALAAAERKELPPKPVVLTFDDGTRDHFETAFPLLKKHGARGVFFVITGKPGRDARYADWEELREMAAAGQEIGAHSVTHRDLTTLSAAELEEEIVGSREKIAEEIGVAPVSFCYPAGKVDSSVATAAIDAGFLFARTTRFGRGVSADGRVMTPTIRVLPETSVAAVR